MLHHQRPSAPASEVATWPVLTLLAPHVEHALQYQAGLPDRAADLWWLLDDCATARQYGGDPMGAVAVFETARMLAEQHFGDLHANTLAARGNLANSYRSAGRIPEAIILQEQVLADRVSVSGDHHRNTLGARGSLASSYWSAGRIPEAIILQEQVLADSMNVFGDLHPDTLTIRANLAASYWSADRIPEAITLLRQAVKQATTLGFEHPHLASWTTALSNWQR